MRILQLISGVTVLVSAASTFVFGAERGSVPNAVLEQLEFMVGKWEEFPEGEGGPDRVLTHERVWLPGKHALLVSWSGVFDGVTVRASGIVGYDSTTNQLTEHWYMTDGTYFETCYPIDKMTATAWDGTTSWVDRDGRRVTGTCRLQKEGKHQFVWTTNVKVDDEVQPPYRVVTRRTAESQLMSDTRTGGSSSASALLREYAALMVGEWECEAAVPWGSPPGSDKVRARATCSWTADGAALEWNLRIGDRSAQALVCFDPISNHLREFGVGASGAHFKLDVTKESGKWTHKGTMTLPDGTRTDIRMSTTFAEDGNTHVNEYQSHKDEFRRVGK